MDLHFLFKGKEVLEKERQRIIDQYLAGSLAVDEVDAFESLLFDNPELQDEVQLAMSLREGLTDYIAEYANDAAIQLERSTGVLSGFFGKWSAVAAGSFASLMLGVLLTAGLLGIDNAQDGAAEADIPVMTFSRIRSAAQDSQFSYIVDRSELTSKLSVLEMEVDYPASDKYSIELSDLTGDGQPIQLTATPNSRGYLVFSVPNEYFESGNYQIEISAIDDNNNKSSSSLFHTIYKLRVD